MRRNKQEKHLKYLLRLDVELNKVENEIFDQPYVKLEKPYQNGWIITISLRDDIARSDKGEFFKHLIKIGLYNYITTRDIKIIRAIRAGKITRIEDIYPPGGYGYEIEVFRNITQKHYNNLSTKQRKYLYKGVNGYYKLSLPSFYIKLQVKPNIITHAIILDRKLEKRKAELESQLKSYKYLLRIIKHIFTLEE